MYMNYDKLMAQAISEKPSHDLYNSKIIAEFCGLEIIDVLGALKDMRIETITREIK